MSSNKFSERENRIYQARLYCEQARLVLSQTKAGITLHLLEMAIMELRSEEARAKAGDALMEPKPRRPGRGRGAHTDGKQSDAALDDPVTAQ